MKRTKAQERECDAFFRKIERAGLALSFGDVRARTRYSEISPSDSDLGTNFSRRVGLRMPIVSAAMDTVTEHKMAIVLAKLGGLGIIHRALTPKDQAAAVSKVKYDLNGFIPNPICISENDTVEQVLNLKAEKGYKFFSFMVKNEQGYIVGLVTRADFEFCQDFKSKISEIMSTNIISATGIISVAEARQTMLANRKKILPIFSAKGAFEGIYTLADVERILNGDSHNHNLDASGSLRVGAAIGTGADTEERLELLSRHKVDVVVIDTAHGNSKAVVEIIKYCKKNYPNIDVVAGNISEGEAAKRLVDAGADGIKVGQGPGSICTTRIVAGIGCPQVTAIYNCEKAIRGSGVPICADGGIELSGDVTIALGAGADCVMLGSLLAGTKESPGEIVFRNGKPVKMYRGMGSLDAMLQNQASKDRYGQGNASSDKLVPEGVKSWLNFKGDVTPIVYQLVGGLRAGMGYLGTKTIPDLRQNIDFFQITNAGLKESYPHGLDYIDEETGYTSH